MTGTNSRPTLPDSRGRFGDYGGRFVPETLMAALEELELDDLDIDEEDVEAKTQTIEVYLPPKKQAGRILEGEIPQQVSELVSLLRSEAKVI